jgi:hypothetical protein
MGEKSMERIVTDPEGRMIEAKLMNNSVHARRLDGQPLTEQDWRQVFRCFSGLPKPPAPPVPAPPSVDHGSDEAARAVAAWERLLGVKLNEKVVEAHIETLRRWQARWVPR